MTERKELEYILQQAARQQLLQGKIDRREFMARSLVAGLGMAGVAATAKMGIGSAFAQDRPLTPTFYQWIEDLHPGIPAVNEKFPGINYQIAPVEGFGIERFVAEAKNGESTWDVYVGQTPFVEMSAMIEADVIEPWDDYIPKDVLDDIIPSIREENMIDGKMYGWPFLLDVIGNSWHSGLTTKAGLPDAAPATWDDHLANAKAIVDSGAAPFGATFDSHGWRSLAPMTHSMSSDVYTSEGLFDFTSDAAIEALKLMKNIMALSHPDILLEGATDGGVNGTPDEVAFAAQRVGYYHKYFNAPLRMAQNWDDPKPAAHGPAAEVRQRRRLDRVLDDGLRALQARQEQGEGGRIHQGADLRPADLEGLDPGHRKRPSGPAAALRVRLRGMGRQQAGLDAAFRRTGARPARPGQGHHQPHLWPAAVPNRQAALGDLPEGRRGRSEGRHAEGRRRGSGRNEARLTTRNDLRARADRPWPSLQEMPRPPRSGASFRLVKMMRRHAQSPLA